MHAHPIVIELYVLEDALLGLVPRPIAPPFRQFPFQRLEERLGHRVVQRRAGPRCRLDYAMRVQAPSEGTGGVPRALVVMEDEAAVIRRALPANRLPHRVDRDLPGDALGHRPARDLAGEGACRGCEIGPPFSCGHAGDAARPKPVAPAHGESALYQVQPRVSRPDLLLDAVLSGRAPSGRSVLPHGAERALLAHGDAAFSQLAVDAPVAAAAPAPLEGLDGEPFERPSLYLGVGSPPAEIPVETGFRDFHQPACLLDGADPAPMPFEELEPHAWS